MLAVESIAKHPPQRVELLAGESEADIHRNPLPQTDSEFFRWAVQAGGSHNCHFPVILKPR
jgi:hypothetical protein